MKGLFEVISSLGRLFWGVILLGVLAYLFSSYDRGNRGSPISRVKSDMRSMATVLEQYRLDHGAWPPLTSMPGFPRKVGTPFPALTTPVAYLSSAMPDSFSKSPLAMYRDTEGYLMICPGPDGDFDIVAPKSIYRGADGEAANRARLEASPWTYDPTNGAKSSGDVWRVREE